MLQGVADLREASTCSDCKLEHYLTHLIQTSQQVNEIGTVSTFLQIGKLRFKQKWLTFELFTLCQVLC